MQDIEYNSIIEEFKYDIDTASGRWRNFLLSRSPHPGRFEQHLLPVDAIESANGLNAPTNINRYLMRSVEIDMVKSNQSLMTYAKMGRFILFGYIISPNSKWIGTKISINSGIIKPREYTLPYGLMNFLFDRANNMEKLSESISDRQKDISDKQLEKNFDKFSRSDHMRAMMADYELFGESAIVRSKK